MKRIGLFYGSATAKTAAAAGKIKAAFTGVNVDVVPVEEAGKVAFEMYDYIIAGTSTWFDGELPTYWDEFMPEVDTLNLKGKKVAVFGLGDQKKYPDNFVDGIGTLARALEARGATLVGFTSAEGYSFEKSTALRKGLFMGLALDVENQNNLTDERILQWVGQLRKELFG